MGWKRAHPTNQVCSTRDDGRREEAKKPRQRRREERKTKEKWDMGITGMLWDC